MTAIIVYPEKGRAAWPFSGLGGTLSADGTEPGRWFRAPAKGATVAKVGLTGYRANRDNAECSINDYAVFRAVVAMQKFFGTPADGIWGSDTDAKVKIWQTEHGLTPDGVFGRLTARALWTPVIEKTAAQTDDSQRWLTKVTVGHVTWESDFDAAAVGGTTPQDVGLGQINGPSHPDLTLDQRLDPVFTIKWLVGFVDSNLAEFPGDLDAGIAAYNLGKGGARSWIKAGRPDIWTRVNAAGTTVTTNVRKYINEIKKAGGIPV